MASRKQMVANLKARIDGGDFRAPMLEIVPAPVKQPRELFLQIGKKRYQVASIEQAVAMYTTARDAAEHGASKMPSVTIVGSTGIFLYRISYNGRVWDVDGKPLDGMSCDEWVNRASVPSKSN